MRHNDILSYFLDGRFQSPASDYCWGTVQLGAPACQQIQLPKVLQRPHGDLSTPVLAALLLTL